MFTNSDQEQINERGSNLPEIQNQISHFKKGFPFLKTVEAAGIGNGIVRLSENECLHLVALRYAIMINGVTDLIMMKADVMDHFETIKICTSYNIEGVSTKDFPNEIDDQVIPVYVELPGWKSDLTEVDSTSKFPEALDQYIRFIEDDLKVPITIVSVGPNRSQTIER